MLKLQASGYLGADCKVSPVPSDPSKVVLFFNIATEQYHKGEKKTQWIKCTRFVERDKEKLSPYLKKGTRVWVDGKPQWQANQAQNGQWFFNVDLILSEIELMGNKPNGDTAPQPVTQPQQTNNAVEEPEEELPF
jgi:single-strand DNA-binding protein